MTEKFVLLLGFEGAYHAVSQLEACGPKAGWQQQLGRQHALAWSLEIQKTGRWDRNPPIGRDLNCRTADHRQQL